MDEVFEAQNIDLRRYSVTLPRTCEGVQRALLEQSDVASRASSQTVEATRNLQPQPEDHVQLHVRVSCMSHGAEQARVFVSAVQDRHALKKPPRDQCRNARAGLVVAADWQQ